MKCVAWEVTSDPELCATCAHLGGARDEKEILELKVSIVLEEAAMHPGCARCSPPGRGQPGMPMENVTSGL